MRDYCRCGKKVGLAKQLAEDDDPGPDEGDIGEADDIQPHELTALVPFEVGQEPGELRLLACHLLAPPLAAPRGEPVRHGQPVQPGVAEPSRAGGMRRRAANGEKGVASPWCAFRVPGGYGHAKLARRKAAGPERETTLAFRGENAACCPGAGRET